VYRPLVSVNKSLPHISAANDAIAREAALPLKSDVGGTGLFASKLAPAFDLCEHRFDIR
jgi:hypothetical protein